MTEIEMQIMLQDIVINNKKYPEAKKILLDYYEKVEKAQGKYHMPARISIYSATPNTIKRIIEDEDKAEIIELVRESLEQKTEIAKLLLKKEAERRNQDKLESFFELFDKGLGGRRLFILAGETGVGKTYSVLKRYPDISTYTCTKALDPYSLLKVYDDKDGKGMRAVKTPFYFDLVEGRPTFFDEINNGNWEFLMMLQGITDDKDHFVFEDEVIPIHPNWRAICTMNPNSDTDERQQLGDALLGRSIGVIMTLTDEILIERLGVDAEWLSLVRKLFIYVRSSGFIDVRDLNYRDYESLFKADFETQFEWLFGRGDIENIRSFNAIKESQEYREEINKIYQKTKELKKNE